MTDPRPLSFLRERGWSGIPSTPGVYWWYFKPAELDRLRVSELCEVDQLRLRVAPDGKVCLYHGMANNLAERIEWHAAQRLTLKCLETGFLSTFRLTLLALNEFDYLSESSQIDDFFDTLSVGWQAANSREEAESLERGELNGMYHYPLNIQGNKCPELAGWVRHLKATRASYKRRFLGFQLSPLANQRARSQTPVYLVSCVSQKCMHACAARDLYVSDLFRKARGFAEASGCPWYVLSARHGLVAPDQVVAPYEQTLTSMRIDDRRAWGERVAKQLLEAVPRLSAVVFLAGERYREFLVPHLQMRGVEVSVPMEGLRIGQQLRWLGQHSPQRAE